MFLVKGPKTQKRSKGFSPSLLVAPVAMALYNKGSGIPVIQMNRMCPHPKKGAGLAQGGGRRSIKQEIGRWNMTIPFLNRISPFQNEYPAFLTVPYADCG
jgi:hypothetical protein